VTAAAARKAESPTGEPSNAQRCPLCGGRAVFAFVATDRNRRVSEQRFRYCRCGVCSTIFLADVPGELAAYYDREYYPFDADGEPPWRHSDGLLAAEAWRGELLRRVTGGGSLIDVGAGAGGFVAAAQQRGFTVTAIEMNSECCRYIGTSLGAEAICSDRPAATLRALPSAQVVTLWHVLEHLPDPREMLAAAADALLPGGVLALGVPNPESIQFRLLGSRWPHLDAPRHLCLMPASAVLGRARELGLEPMLKTTNDPFGRLCNVHGWVYALRRDPSVGPPSPTVLRVGTRLAALLAPLERRESRGAALTLLLRKPPA
jgi:2-polyprenyl-3-methyl-5-hydroxy-6-metoxy-1,4-benzoquinol methylase